MRVRSPVPTARANARLRTAVLVAVAMSVIYAITLVLYIARPEYQGPEPTFQLLDDYPWLKVQIILLIAAGWISLAAWFVTGTLSRVALDESTRLRWLMIGNAIALIVLLAPYLVLSIDSFSDSGAWALVCALTTTVGLLLITRLQRFARMIWWIPVYAVGWGAFVAPGFIKGLNAIFQEFYPAYTFSGDASISAVDTWTYHSFVALIATFGPGEELAKGAGIVLLCALFRKSVTGVVSGIVIGAGAGLGFNFTESLSYMGNSSGAADVFQLWARQGLSLMAAHLAFSATVGAGVGLAIGLSSKTHKLAAIGAGFALASCCHVAMNLVLTYVQVSRGDWLPLDEEINALVILPVVLLIMSLPLTVLYLIMARADTRAQADGVARELGNEAATGYGAVIPIEVPVLLSPRRRFRRKLLELRRHGFAAYRRLDQLYAAQLRLGAHRWLASTGDSQASTTDMADLRERALRCKLKGLGGVQTAHPGGSVQAAHPDSADTAVLAGVGR